MIGFRDEHRREEAILFGMEAVNAYQQIRKNISGLGKELQTGFAQSKSATYRMLAELLVQADRLGRSGTGPRPAEGAGAEGSRSGSGGSMPEARLEPLEADRRAASGAETTLEAPEKTAVALMDASAEYADLRAKAARTPEEDARLKTLEAKIEAGNAEVSDFFRKTLYPELAQKAGTQDANALLSKEKSEVSRLQNTLAELGPRVMGIRLLLGDEHAYAIVVTAQGRKKFELKATPAELRSKVLQVRDDLRSTRLRSQAASRGALRDGRGSLRRRAERPGDRALRKRAVSRRSSGRWTAPCATCRWPRSTTATATWPSGSPTSSSLPRATGT